MRKASHFGVRCAGLSGAEVRQRLAQCVRHGRLLITFDSARSRSTSTVATRQ